MRIHYALIALGLFFWAVALPLNASGDPAVSVSLLASTLSRNVGITLTEAETNLLVSFSAGKKADYSSKQKEQNDPALAQGWPPARVIRAEVIRELCVNPEAAKASTPRGIAIRGARIDGLLDLELCRISFPLEFEYCSFTERIVIEEAQLNVLDLEGTHTKGGISGDSVKIEHSLFLRNGFKSAGDVRLPRAEIGGDLDCRRASIFQTNEVALWASGIRVGGVVLLQKGVFVGEVSFLNATIGGSFLCDSGHFLNENKNAVSLTSATVLHDINLSQVSVLGLATLHNVVISGDLDCSQGTFINGTNVALDVGGGRVDHSCMLANVKVNGAVDLRDAVVKIHLNCEGGSFINNAPYSLADESPPMAIMAHGIKVGHVVYMRNGMFAKGVIAFVSANVGSYFIWKNIISSTSSTLDLRSATIGTLADEEASWPGPGRILLHGFVYGMIEEKALVSPSSGSARIRWLRMQPGNQFHPQPYEQLAGVLRKQGRDEDAKDVLVAKNEDPTLLREMGWFGRGAHWLFGFCVGYGYRPWRALIISIVWVGIGYLVFAIFASDSKTFSKTKSHGAGAPYPTFNPAIYSLETFVPLLKLGQNDFWAPNSDALRGQLCQLFVWVHVIVGWVLTTMWASALAGIVRG